MFIIGITGGSASGKTLLCKKIISNIQKSGYTAETLSEDNFYFGLPDGTDASTYNFDSPDAIDFNGLYQAIIKLQSLKNKNDKVEIPTYNFASHKQDGVTHLSKCDVLIVEGILLFTHTELNDLFKLKIFVDASPEIRFARRIKRDLQERGNDIDTIINRYLTFVKPSYDTHILPTKAIADIVINNNFNHNLLPGIDFVVLYTVSRLAMVAMQNSMSKSP